MRSSKSGRRLPSGWARRKRFVLMRDNYLCRLCYKSFPPADSADHIIPVTRGGSEDVSNLQAAHLRCNLQKGNRMLSTKPKPSRFG